MSYLPLFPLNVVVYPGEVLNLHIFEPRYRQLMAECVDSGMTFGMPTFLDGRLPGLGCEVSLIEVVERYDDGRMDIRVCGTRVFELLDLDNPAPDKLYARGLVEYREVPEQNPPVAAELVELVERLYVLLSTQLKADPQKPQPYSYQLGHNVGLPLEGEYELLTLDSEVERQLYLLEHLKSTLPVLEDMERTRARIRMNGHFREFDPLNF